MQRNPQQMQCLRLVGFYGQHTPIDFLRHVEPAGLVVLQGYLECLGNRRHNAVPGKEIKFTTEARRSRRRE
jgi:hypothetical protein